MLAQAGEELIILDQHGAHERILYEKLLKDVRGTPADSRPSWSGSLEALEPNTRG